MMTVLEGALTGVQKGGCYSTSVDMRPRVLGSIVDFFEYVYLHSYKL